MEERKEKRHLQGMRNVLLAFAFCFVCALFVGVSPVYAAKQECGYKITEADQDFIVWAKDNIFKKDNIKQYVYVTSLGMHGALFHLISHLKKPMCVTIGVI